MKTHIKPTIKYYINTRFNNIKLNRLSGRETKKTLIIEQDEPVIGTSRIYVRRLLLSDRGLYDDLDSALDELYKRALNHVRSIERQLELAKGNITTVEEFIMRMHNTENDNAQVRAD